MTLIEHLHFVDRDLTLAINSLHCTQTDYLWLLFSNKSVWFVMYAIVAFFLFRRLGWRRALLWIVAIVLMITCCDQFSNFIKDLVARWRPCKDPYMLYNGLWVLEGGGNYGFYSAHAANTMAFAVGSLMAFRSDGSRCRPYAIWIFSWAFLVGISRIFVGKHFLGDVLVGFLVGAVIAQLIGLMALWLTKRLVFFRPAIH